MRYFVDALNPPATAPARLFEDRPDEGTYFSLLWGNRKYLAFRVVSRADEFQAAEIAARARSAFERGDLEEAERAAVEALDVHPRQPDALELLRHVGALRDQGFEDGGETN
jgi:hypothetical protein